MPVADPRQLQQWLDRVALGAGRFCTKPGLILVPAGSAMAASVDAATTGAAVAPLVPQRIDGVLR